MRINKEKFNWYGFDHNKVREKYGDLDGNLEYVGTFCIGDRHYKPFAVYYSPNPDRSKGHKNYVCFFKDDVLLTFYVTGFDAEQIEKDRYQTGLYCENCGDVVYSVMRHDCRYCRCGKVMIDGGRDYMRSSGIGIPVKIDLLKGEATVI